jgi:hypothetical protein
VVEDLRTGDEVRSATDQVERRRHAPSTAVVLRRTPSAGEGESRTLDQELEHVLAGVRAEASDQ